MSLRLKDFVSGASIARHTITIAAMFVVGVISLTRVLDQVQATGDKTKENSIEIKVIKELLGKLDTQQHVIIQRLDNIEERSRDFRNRTDLSLDRILDKLTPRTNHRMRPQ